MYAAGTVPHQLIGKQNKHRHRSKVGRPRQQQISLRRPPPRRVTAQPSHRTQASRVHLRKQEVPTLPLLQQTSVLDNLQTHDGNLQTHDGIINTCGRIADSVADGQQTQE